CGLTEILGHLVGRGHGLGRQRLQWLAFDHLGQRGEGHRQRSHHGDPGRDDEPRRAHDEATQHRKRADVRLGLTGGWFFEHGGILRSCLVSGRALAGYLAPAANAKLRAAPSSTCAYIWAICVNAMPVRASSSWAAWCRVSISMASDANAIAACAETSSPPA